jgi:hypothetical protein
MPPEVSSHRPHPFLLAGFLLVPLTALIELSMHRLPISQSHRILLWSPITSPELSQQIADAYSFSHIIHGLAFYAIFRLITRRWGKFSLPLCFFLAMLSECSWEILENTPMIIERYRRSALAAGYYGDSILNSTSDILFAALGFYLAAKFPTWASIALLVVIELTLAITIRDNLALNIINLIHPFDFIKNWQSHRGF